MTTDIGVTAQLYLGHDPYIPTHRVFAMKDDLWLDFVPTDGKGPGSAKFDVESHVDESHVEIAHKYKPDAKMFRQNAARGVKGETAAKIQCDVIYGSE